MQTANERMIAARSALLALGAAIDSVLAQLIEVLRTPVLDEPADERIEDILQQLTEIEGALAHAGQSGLRALVTHVRTQLRSLETTNAVDTVRALAHVVAWAFERLMQRGEVLAADLLRCWQRHARPGGATDPAVAHLLSLQLPEGAVLPLLPLPPAPPGADPLADGERALLACLRADDDSDRVRATRSFADVLAAMAAQASHRDAGLCWLILHAYLLELAQTAGSLAVSDKKLLAATVRALRHRHGADLMTVLEPLARDALFALSAPCLQTEVALAVARLLRLDIQLAGLPEDESPATDQPDARVSFGLAVAKKIAVLDGDPERIGDPALWCELANEAGHAPHMQALADALRRLAVQVPDSYEAPQRELLAALLIDLHAWSADGATDAGAMAAVLDLACDGDIAFARNALVRQVQSCSARRRLACFCDTIGTELSAAEQVLEAAWQSGDTDPALSTVDGVLTQVAGALALYGLQDGGDDVAALKALVAGASIDADPRLALHSAAAAWVTLAASIALLPSQLTPSQLKPLADPTRTDGPPVLTMPAGPFTQAVAVGSRLHAIFLDEVAEHLRSLRALAAGDCAEYASAVALRAVHTVAGCSATVGQSEMAGLALALENYLMAAGWRPGDALLADAMYALERMLDDFATAGQCAAPTALIARLQVTSPLGDGHADATPDACQSESEHAEAVDEAGDDDPSAAIDDVSVPALTSLPADIDAALIQAPDTALTAEPLMPSIASLPALPSPTATDDGSAGELLAIFDEEAADLLPQLETALLAWHQHPDGREPPRQLLRVLHTLKGGARMAGRQALGEEFHEAEAEVTALAQQSPAAVLQALPALQERMDRWMQGSMPVLPTVGASPLLHDECAGAATSASSGAGAAGDAGVTEAAVADANAAVARLANANPAATPQLRVAAGQLARVADAAAALWVGNACISDVVQDQRHAIAALSGDLSRLRVQLRELEIESESRILSRASHGNDAGFDPLEFDRYTRLHELTRMMAESLADLSGVQRGLARQVERLALAASAQARDMRQCQLDVQSMRSQPLRSIEPRLRYLLRQAAREAGREAGLVLTGGDVEIERSLLDRLIGPFGHLLRNAAVHGIEPAVQRVALGKPRAGTVTIAAALAGNELRLSLHDDGRGLDLGQMRSRALSAGLLGMDEQTDDAALTALIFAPGFSTAATVTTLSGRGIGMDAVRAGLQALGGRIEVDSAPGQGCRFTITLPLALVSLPVLLASAGTRRVALPVARVRQIVQPGPGQIEHHADGQQILWRGKWLPLRHLGRALGDAVKVSDDEAARLPVAIVQEGERLLALRLDAVAGQRDVMVKHAGPQLAQVPGIGGATVLGDGGIVLIIDPFRLPATPVAAEPPVPERPLVLVVDDSLTVRRASQRLLERHGYAVVLARDGVEALERLGERRPAALLLDIEMPRMDGFELLAALRADVALCGLPVVMITSRIADRHRERAQQLGVLAYLGKPFDEEVLLALLADLRTEAPLAA